MLVSARFMSSLPRDERLNEAAICMRAGWCYDKTSSGDSAGEAAIFMAAICPWRPVKDAFTEAAGHRGYVGVHASGLRRGAASGRDKQRS